MAPAKLPGLILGLSVIVLYWCQLFYQLQVEWSANAQYNYGWFVPALAAVLLWRRWVERPGPEDGGRRTEDGGQGAVGGGRRTEDGGQSSVISHQSSVISRQSSVVSGPCSCFQLSGFIPHPSSRFLLSAFCFLLCFLLLPLRIIHEANVGWRSAQWLHALILVALTLMVLWRAGGWIWVRHFGFPVLFLLVAVPWPSRLENYVTQGLMRLVAAATVEVVGLFGIPAMQRGNLLEIGSGVVSVDGACSGVRSLQTSLMLALFLGEMYRLRYWWRLALVPASLLIAFAANVGRTSFLTWSAARLGMARMESLHGSAGLAVVVIVFGLLWLAARLLTKDQGPWTTSEAKQKAESRKQKWDQDNGRRTTDDGSTLNYQPSTLNSPPPLPTTDHGLRTTDQGPETTSEAKQKAENRNGMRTTDDGSTLNYQPSTLNSPPPPPPTAPPSSDFSFQPSAFSPPDAPHPPSSDFSFQLSAFSIFRPSSVLCLSAALTWLLCIEGAAVVWFRIGDKRSETNQAWSINWPTAAPGYREEQLSKLVFDMLRYDTAKSVTWQDEAGNRWGFSALRWGPDNKNSFIGRGHTPDLCFGGAGWKLVSEPAPARVTINGIELPFRRYVFEEGGVTSYAFLALWDERSPGGRQETPFAYGITRRLKAAMQGKRHQGLKKLEISIIGPTSADAAVDVLTKGLKELVEVQNPTQTLTPK
jgi:exosortase